MVASLVYIPKREPKLAMLLGIGALVSGYEVD